MSLTLASRAVLAERVANKAMFFANGLGVGAWAASIPLLKARLDLSAGSLSLALLAFAIGAVCSMPITGLAAPRASAGQATRIGALGWALSLALPDFAPTLTILIGAAFVMGATNGMLDVAMNGQASSIETRWGSPIMSSFHAVFSIGGLCGAGLGALVAGLDAPVSALRAAAIVNFVLLVAAWAPLEWGRQSAPASARLAAPGREALLLCFCVCLSFLAEGSVGDWSAVYLNSIVGASPQAAALGFAGFSAMMVTGRLIGDRLTARFGRIAMVRGGSALAALGLALAALVPWPAAGILGFALVGAGLSNVVPVFFGAAGRLAASPAAGVAMAATSGYAGLLFGPPIIGAIATAVGLRLALVFIVACAAIVALAAGRALARG